MSLLEQAKAIQTANTGPTAMQVRFLADIPGPDLVDPSKDRIVFRQGQEVDLPANEAKHWMNVGEAEPVCADAQKFCAAAGLTDTELLKRFKASQLLRRGEIHTTEPASISEPQ